MDESFRIRPLGPEDAEHLGDLLAEVAADPEAGHFRPHPFTHARRSKSRSGRASEMTCFAAVLEGRLVGYGMLRGWGGGYAIPSFGVALGVRYRGLGVGRSLLH